MPKSIICILFNSRCEVEINKKDGERGEEREREGQGGRRMREGEREGQREGEGEGHGYPLVLFDPALLSGGHPEDLLLFSIYTF